MVAAHTHHRGHLDAHPTIIASSFVPTVGADHPTSRSTRTLAGGTGAAPVGLVRQAKGSGSSHLGVINDGPHTYAKN